MVTKHSYSTLSCFDTCCFQFLHKYVLKTIKFTQNEAARYGSEGHKACEDAVKAKTLPEGRWSFVAPTLQAIYKSAGEAEIFAEKELGITEDKKPIKFLDGHLRGKLDLYYKPAPDKGVILDYKFAKYDPDKYNLEMSVFSYLSWLNDPELEYLKRGLLWMKQDSPGAPTMSVVSRSKDFAEIEDTVRGKIQRVERALELDNFPCKPGPLCGWCDVKTCKFHVQRRK